MKKRYKLESGFDTTITLEIDTDKIPEDLARRTNAFWMYADHVLSLSDGDVFQAVARRAAGPLLGYLLDGFTEDGAVAQLLGEEGWPGGGGITIIDHEFPGLSADDFEVVEIMSGAQ